MELKIVSLKGKKFKSEYSNTICECTGNYALFNKEKGYLSFKGDNEKNTVKTPYANTKKVLQSIIDDVGLIHYDDVEWLQTIN